MRIGVDASPLCSPFPATGIPRSLREILRELQKLDQENEYRLYSKCDFDLPLENRRWRKCIHPRIPYLLGNLYLRDGVTRNGRQDDLDVFWTTRTHAFPLGLSPTVARVLTVYDLVWLLYPETMETVNRLAQALFAARGIRDAHRIIAISESTRRGLIERTAAPSDKVDVVHLGADSRFAARNRLESARFVATQYGVSPDYICTVGTVEPRKNIITLIEAVKILRDRNQLRHQFVIAGASGWKNSSIYAGVQRCGLTEGEVKFLGRVPDEDLPLLYSGAALFVFPSFYEGFGLPLVEAMASGVPVVASNTSSVPEVVQDAGILVSPRRPEEFADAIARVIADSALSRTLVENGLKHAREFTWAAAAMKTRRVLEQAAQAIGRLRTPFNLSESEAKAGVSRRFSS